MYSTYRFEIYLRIGGGGRVGDRVCPQHHILLIQNSDVVYSITRSDFVCNFRLFWPFLGVSPNTFIAPEKMSSPQKKENKDAFSTHPSILKITPLRFKSAIQQYPTIRAPLFPLNKVSLFSPNKVLIQVRHQWQGQGGRKFHKKS